MGVTKDYIDRAQLKKYQGVMLAGKEQNINEADTVLRLVKMFEDVFGYDPFTEISREAQLRDRFVDLMLKLDGVPVSSPLSFFTFGHLSPSDLLSGGRYGSRYNGHRRDGGRVGAQGAAVQHGGRSGQRRGDGIPGVSKDGQAAGGPGGQARRGDDRSTWARPPVGRSPRRPRPSPLGRLAR